LTVPCVPCSFPGTVNRDLSDEAVGSLKQLGRWLRLCGECRMPFPNSNLLRKMIRQAIVDRPALLIRLEKAGELDKAIEARATQAEELYQNLLEEVPEEKVKELIKMQSEPMGAAQWFTRLDQKATQAALAQAMEFPDFQEVADPGGKGGG
jgi:hypothetical protein